MSGLDSQHDAAIPLVPDLLFWVPRVFQDPPRRQGTNPNAKSSRSSTGEDPDAFPEMLCNIEVTSWFEPIIQSLRFHETVEFQMPQGILPLGIARLGNDVQAGLIQGHSIRTNLAARGAMTGQRLILDFDDTMLQNCTVDRLQRSFLLVKFLSVRRTGVERRQFDVWAVGADAQIQLSHQCGVRGEFFMGQALGNYIGGIAQFFNPVTFDAVRSSGGWGELYMYWKPNLHSHFGAGVDDPLDSTLSEALPTLNAFAFANVIWDVTKNLEIGFELGRWDTDYTPAPSLGPLAPGDNDAMVYRTRVQIKF